MEPTTNLTIGLTIGRKIVERWPTVSSHNKNLLSRVEDGEFNDLIKELEARVKANKSHINMAMFISCLFVVGFVISFLCFLYKGNDLTALETLKIPLNVLLLAVSIVGLLSVICCIISWSNAKKTVSDLKAGKLEVAEIRNIQSKAEAELQILKVDGLLDKDCTATYYDYRNNIEARVCNTQFKFKFTADGKSLDTDDIVVTFQIYIYKRKTLFGSKKVATEEYIHCTFNKSIECTRIGYTSQHGKDVIVYFYSTAGTRDFPDYIRLFVQDHKHTFTGQKETREYETGFTGQHMNQHLSQVYDKNLLKLQQLHKEADKYDGALALKFKKPGFLSFFFKSSVEHTVNVPKIS